MKKTNLSLLVAVGLIASISQSKADTFGTGDNQFTLDFTMIGNAGNSADPLTGFGSVGYVYRIGTYAISQNQIDAATSSGLQNVVAGAWSGDQPAANMTWYESAAFVNWLNTSRGFLPAYNLNWSGSTWSMDLWTAADAGYDASNPYRKSLAKYFLPSENEFYKAAFGKSDGSGYYRYTTASDTDPIPVTGGTSEGTAVYYVGSQPASVYRAGGLSSYGTMGQGGNVEGWVESAVDGVNDSATKWRACRNGYWYAVASDLRSTWRNCNHPDYEHDTKGFRVASVEDVGSVPEPSTYALFGLGAIVMLMVVRRKKTA
jgi:formylglycine-generating enzyme required for sulfatase activity